jgi:hypothetical protein
MASRNFQQFQGSLEKGVVKLYCSIVTSTSGTISSSDMLGGSVTKVAAEAGRYRIALSDSYQRLLAVSVMVEGASDTAYTTAKGIYAIVRNVDVDSSSAPLLDIQLVRSDTAADAEVIDSANIFIEITLSNSSV